MSTKKLTTVKPGDDEDEPELEEEEEDEIKSDSDSDDTIDDSDESEKESNKSEEETDTIDDEEDSIVSSTDEDTEDDEEENVEDAEDNEDGIKNKPIDTFKIEKKPKKNNKKPATTKKPKKHDDEDIEDMIDDINIDDEDDEDEDEDIEPDYLQKFDESIRKKIIEQYHPEMIIKNNAEIETLSRVVRDSNGNIIDPFHKTLPFLTKYEKARILGERANQINEGSPIFVNVDNDVIDGYLIALKEFEERKIPFIIQRPLPNGTCEYWRLQDLEII
jgi:DNA-directed RNA polymerase subunit K/omega